MMMMMCGTTTSTITKVALLFAVGAVVCFGLYYHSPNHFQLLSSFSCCNHSTKKLSFYVREHVELKKVLKKAAMANNTIIITTINDAWARPDSIFDLFLESFKIGNQTPKFLNHLVVVAFDQKAYARCSQLQLNCYALTTDGVDFSGQANFMTNDYLKMMWRRIYFLSIVLEMGYNFVFTDADILWFRDPFPQFNPDADFQIACDRYNGNPIDLNNAPNGGFNYAKSNKKTIAFYKFWYDSRIKYPEQHDQDVLNEIKHEAFFSEIGLEIRFLDTVYFGGICQPSKDFNLVCTMHANCCIGLDKKIHDLKVMLEDWKNYTSLSAANHNVKQLSSWRIPQRCA